MRERAEIKPVEYGRRRVTWIWSILFQFYLLKTPYPKIKAKTGFYARLDPEKFVNENMRKFDEQQNFLL